MDAFQKYLLLHVLTCFGQYACGSKIIHGEISQENSLPYMVSVQNSRGHICGGFLVSEDFVLTAAHCGDRFLDPTRVVYGSNNLWKMKTERAIVKQCKHPFYIHAAYGYDIMLLKNQKCQVAGWGKTWTFGTVVNDLRVVNVSVIDPELCREQWTYLPRGVICAGGYGTDKGFCQGDSGGPLVCNGVAVGVVSFNKQGICSYPNAPNVYTDITQHIDWIYKILKENGC